MNESIESDFPFPLTALVMSWKEPIRNQNIDVFGIQRHSLSLSIILCISCLLKEILLFFSTHINK